MRSSASAAVVAAATCAFAFSTASGRESEGIVWFRGDVSAGASVAALGGAVFSAAGSAGGRSETVAVHGASIGLDHVELATVGVHFLVGVAPHVAIGVSGAVLWSNGVLGGGIGASQLGGDLSGLAAGPELSTLWHFKRLELRGSVAFGGRTLWLPAVGLDSVSCGSRKFPWARCDVRASTSALFLEPRLGVGILLLPVLSFGAYAGGNVMPSGGWSAGAFVAGSTSGWQSARGVGR
jgi:hypothetical protein